MPEREPMHPDVAAALRAYEIAILEGTERSQQEAFLALQETQKRQRLALGGAALAVAGAEPALESAEPDERQSAAG